MSRITSPWTAEKFSSSLSRRLFKHYLGAAIASAALLGIPAHGAPAPATESASGQPGEATYKQVCAVCHEAGVSKAPSRSMLGFMAPGTIHTAITSGIMQAQASHLSDQQKRDVVRYLTGRDPDASASEARLPMCSGQADKFDASRPPQLVGWGFTPDNRREIPPAVAGIDRDNVSRLELQWVFAFPDAVRARSHPAAAGGAIYVGSQDGTVYALDRESGCVRWHFRARSEVRTAIVVAPWVAPGDAVNPLLYFGDFLGNVYALAAKTGELVWSARPDDHPNATITGSPTLFGGKLYVPVSSLEVTSAADPAYGCCSFRGSVVAYDAASGKQLWKTYTIENPPAAQKENAAGVMQYGPSGAPIWNSPAIDAKRGQLYVGTGENYSSPANGSSDAIIAMDLETGATRWVFQATSGDAWNSACILEDTTNCPAEDGPDFDFGGAALLASGADGRELVLAGQKSGMVWALNPEDGGLVWKQRAGRGGVIGGVHFGVAVSGDALIVPVADAIADPTYRNNYTGQPMPGVVALDIATGKIRWRWDAVDVCEGRPYCMPGNSAVPTATPELAIAGSLDGHLRIHDVRNGEILWDFDTARDYPETLTGLPGRGGALEGGAAALLDNGMLFVNSGYMFNQHMPGNVLLAFKVANEAPTP
ncbi:PQQ-binding-like beta-propeller repeat protein [Haliea sp. E17]|uniref:outer membrane protein assembly factor BamB family protein n=1 Tax=Haliea sp. E17 TaxID=3401576 RepID=UPI003AADA257